MKDTLSINIDAMEGLRGIHAESVSCVITSPPYNVGIKYGTYRDNRSDYLPWLRGVFCEVYRVLQPDGHFFLQVGSIATKPLIPWEVLQQATEAGFVLQNSVVWVKNITIGEISYGHFKPINSKRFLNHTHEFIYHLTKTGDVPVNRLAIGTGFVDKSNIKRFEHTHDLRCRGDVWYIPYETVRAGAGKFHHPAGFPLVLPTMCLRFSGIPIGSLVVDPFVGTGTTLVACRELGMVGVGYDVDPDYIRVAAQRLEELDGARRQTVF